MLADYIPDERKAYTPARGEYIAASRLLPTLLAEAVFQHALWASFNLVLRRFRQDRGKKGVFLG